MKIAIIGGAGFIGSHLTDRLLAESHDVDVIDDLSVGSLANLADARSATGGPGTGSLKIHHLDAMSDAAASLIGLRRPELIYDLTLFPRADRSPMAQGRAMERMLATMESARQYGVSKVVVAIPASSLHGQPALSSLPVKEGDIVPRGVRGVAARAVTDLASVYRERDMIEFTALAVSSAYGPRQQPDAGVVAAFVASHDGGRSPRIEGDGRQTRDFVYIDDVVDAFVRASERGSGLVIHVGTGVQTSVLDLWAAVAENGHGASPPEFVVERADELSRFSVSSVRARIHLGWSPWTDLTTGLARLRDS